MPCFYCGKRVSIVRQLTDADFCSDEHRQKYHDLTRTALGRLVESNEQVTAPPRGKGKSHTAPVEEPQAVPEKHPAYLHRPLQPVIVLPSPLVEPDPAEAEFAPLPVGALPGDGDPHSEIWQPEFEAEPFLPDGGEELPQFDSFQYPPPAPFAILTPPDPAPGNPALSIAHVPAEIRPSALSPPARREQIRKHDFPEGGFDYYSPPVPAAKRPSQTVLNASGRATVRPSAMPAFDVPPVRGPELSATPAALAVPRTHVQGFATPAPPQHRSGVRSVATSGRAEFKLNPARARWGLGTTRANREPDAADFRALGTPPPTNRAHLPIGNGAVAFTIPEIQRPQGIATLETTAAPRLRDQSPRTAVNAAPAPTAAPRSETAPIRTGAVQPPPLPAPAVKFAIAGGGVLAGFDPASPRNVPLRPGTAAYVEFLAKLTSLRAQTEPLAGTCKLPDGSALASSGRALAGAARPVLPGSDGIPPQHPKLPEPRSIGVAPSLSGTGSRKLESRAHNVAASSQTAGWEAMRREGPPGFKSMASSFAVATGTAFGGGGFQSEGTPPLAGMSPTVKAVAVDIPAPAVIRPESTKFTVSLRSETVCKLHITWMEDDRTKVKTARLIPLFRAIRRPARLPVFGRAGIGKAGMPAPVFVPFDYQEDHDDYGTGNMVGGAGPCPVRMIMPESKHVGIAGKLGSADLIAPAATVADHIPRTSGFDYRILPLAPHLPDGWVDTIPADFESVAAARGQSWVPLAGAIKSASRFFKFT
jgi:hypothetical protein